MKIRSPTAKLGLRPLTEKDGKTICYAASFQAKYNKE